MDDNIALLFLNLYAMILFIVKSSLQCATEIINLIDLIDREQRGLARLNWHRGSRVKKSGFFPASPIETDI